MYWVTFMFCLWVWYGYQDGGVFTGQNLGCLVGVVKIKGDLSGGHLGEVALTHELTEKSQL